MEVRALTDGFYGGARRRAGKTFQVADGETAKWFEPTNPEDAARVAAKPKGKGKGKVAVVAAPEPAAATDGGGAGDLV